MSAKKMTAEERKMSNAIMKNLKKLMDEKHISTQKEVYSKIPAFTQSQFSNVYNGENFPTMMQLIGLADYFHVSIDYLLDRNISDIEKEMSVIDICKCLAQILSSNNNACFHEISVNEIDIVYSPSTGYPDYERTERTYHALIFSEQTDELVYPLTGPADNARIINTFIKRILQINEMCSKGDLDDDMYEILLDGYLRKAEESFKSLQESKNPELPFD